ncbi:MAG: lipoprotein [Frankiales bacterium]|nr:lipoprotein [Frankiales bacterium]
MHLTRRSALASAGLALVAACTPKGRTAAAPAVDPDVALTAAAVAREQALLAGYDDALAAAPTLASRLAPLRAEHAAHLAALGSPESPGTSSTPASSPTRSPTGPPTPPALLRDLAALERTAATGHATAVLTASRALGPVLASLAASESSHLVLL